MYSDLNVFRTAHAMTRHAGARQAVIARNMANADTPGFKAMDLRPFADLVRDGQSPVGMRASRPGHLNGHADLGSPRAETDRSAPGDPNGNSVSLEAEMVKAVEVKRQHDRGLAITRSALTILRGAIGRR